MALWTLFGDDARLAAFDAEDDHAFVAVTYACLALFTAEMCALCVAKEGYAFGFYFWLDLVATRVMLLDVPEFMDASRLRSPALCDFVGRLGEARRARRAGRRRAGGRRRRNRGRRLPARRAAPRAGTRAGARAVVASRACFDCAGCGARTRRRRRASPEQRWTRHATFARRLRGDCRRDCRLESTKGRVRRREKKTPRDCAVAAVVAARASSIERGDRRDRRDYRGAR